MAGPSNPHRRLPTSALVDRGIAGAIKLEMARAEEAEGLMPDGAVIIAAITSCTNTSNPRNVIAAALLARNANRLGLTRKPWVKTSLAPDRKSTRLNSSHVRISYAVFCLKKKNHRSHNSPTHPITLQ